MSDRVKVGTDLEFIRYLKDNGGDTMKKCYQCATCTVACDLSPQEFAFPRKEMINASWGLKDKLVADPDIWLCHGCQDCSEQCPRGARPADLMGALRNYVYQHYAFPDFMGLALRDPKQLVWLILLPFILIAGLVFVTQDYDFANLTMPEGVFKYKDFIAHGPLEILFVAGNMLIFGLAFTGFKRYWDDLNKNFGSSAEGKGFIGSAITVLFEFMTHKKFDKCPTNSTRLYGHIYMFYGFVGALIATGIVVVDIFGHKLGLFPQFLPEHMNLPMSILSGVDFSDPEQTKELWGFLTKSIGVLGGLMMMIGGLLFIIKRGQTEKSKGTSTYQDQLFLWTIWLVASTGMLLVLFRLTQIPELGYPIYFIHLVFVFFLLWYMPYSKFAHMIYRFIGLVFLKMHGRENKPEIFAKKN